ncbi:MAG: hypothetical protein VX733_14525 [Candidatus Latescibacterota bacterium]|uniref:Uncharacterized protein n=1 Tax=marine metagenome TaxID=408172 RepID=A0A382JJD5_9ZZZZ|nr:hypothetical protein [Candidatus Latescibacterota bacterium]
MEISRPIAHIDRRLQEIDREIHSALRNIRRNLEELEQASRSRSSTVAPTSSGDSFADLLRSALDSTAEGDQKG